MSNATATRTGRILSVQLVNATDTSPDLSYLGKYTDTASEAAIVCDTGEFFADVLRREAILDRLAELAHDEDRDDTRIAHLDQRAQRLAAAWADRNRIPERGREYRFFIPYAGGEKVGTRDWRTYAQQDYKRMQACNRGDWCPVGIMAEARVTLPGSDVVQRITSGGLWGAESDAVDYVREVEQEELAALREELGRVGFGKRAIAAACVKVSTVYR